ncbi:inositol polyphosphate kinase-domain-containing protein [Lipomyces oligophaga]|uniref:inositol polyphosphate kinase-domain-containing protein n=1 Tax=Lipomyces oligophaga TaxID=45792 RepID=UPI0034CF661D
MDSKIDICSAISFENKVAGHDGVLQDASGAVIIKPASPYEVDFYTTISQHPELENIIPQFYGTLQLTQESIESIESKAESQTLSMSHLITDVEQAIVLENVTAGFTKPSVIDIKLGRQLWDDRASPEKRARLDAVASKTTSGSLALRIAGMKIWDQNTSQFKSYDKNYGRSFTAETIKEGISAFFPSTLGRERQKIVLQRIISSVSNIQTVLENEELRMYSSSILIVYETDLDAFDMVLKSENTDKEYEKEQAEIQEEEEDEEELEFLDTIELNGIIERTLDTKEMNNSLADESDDEFEERELCIVKLIDFAHASWTPGKGKDVNMLEGVVNCRLLFENLLNSL